MQPNGFDGRFTLLFDDDTHEQAHLPAPIRQIYQGDWHPLSHPDRPYTFINFVTSRDGRVSYAEPGHSSGGTVSNFNAADIWLMGLLRARADAILMGDGTLHAEPEHLWTCDYICPSDGAAFVATRTHFGMARLPLHVFLSFDGKLVPHAAVFHQAELPIVIATTTKGAQEAALRLQGCAAHVHILDLGQTSVDLNQLMQILFNQYGVRLLLCEGGPRVYGSLLKAGLVDDEFLTLSPLLIGAEPGKQRPSLVEGAAFLPGKAPQSRLLSLRRSGDYLFLRSRWSYPGL